MKDLLSIQHYCNKIHKLMKSSAYPTPLMTLAPYGLPPLLFLQDNLHPPFL